MPAIGVKVGTHGVALAKAESLWMVTPETPMSNQVLKRGLVPHLVPDKRLRMFRPSKRESRVQVSVVDWWQRRLVCSTISLVAPVSVGLQLFASLQGCFCNSALDVCTMRLVVACGSLLNINDDTNA